MKLKELIMQLDVMDSSEWIYTVDKKGCSLCLHKEPMVLGQKGAKRVCIVAHEHEVENFNSFIHV